MNLYHGIREEFLWHFLTLFCGDPSQRLFPSTIGVALTSCPLTSDGFSVLLQYQGQSFGFQIGVGLNNHVKIICS